MHSYNLNIKKLSLVALFLLSFFVKGYFFSAPLNQIESVLLETKSNFTHIELVFSQKILTKLVFDKQEGCWIADFADCCLSTKLANRSFYDETIELMYFSKLPDQRVRLRIYPRENSSIHIDNACKRINLKLTKASTAINKFVKRQQLLSPEQNNFSPVVIDLKKSDPVCVLNELASEAGISLDIKKDQLPKIAFKVEASNSLEAIRALAERFDLSLIKKDKRSWIIE